MRDAVEGQYRKDFTEFLDAGRFQMRGASNDEHPQSQLDYFGV